MNKLMVIFMFLSTYGMAQKLIIVEKVKFLALGDSYTIGEGVTLYERWPLQLIDSLRQRGVDCYEPKIIAATGWRTDVLKSAIENANLKPEYNLVALLVGVNDYYQGKTVESYEPQFRALLNMAISLAGGDKSHVFVVSIPDYGYTPFGKRNQPTISLGIDAFNKVNESIASEVGLAYLYITDISRKGLTEPDLVANDGLHPSGKMYAQWVSCILQNSNLVLSEHVPDNVTGITDEQFGLRIYPNPFYDEINIENIQSPNRTFHLISLNGGTMRSRLQISTTTTIPTENLNVGAYILSVQEGDHEIFQTRVIKL